jgi:hypothetical protein
MPGAAPASVVTYFGPEIDRTISPSSGKRPNAFFEKIFLPSTITSNTPPLDATSSLSTASASFSSAARPAALGR